MQQKIYYEKNRDKLLQKQNEYSKKRSTDYKELHRSYVELQCKVKALEEKKEHKSIITHINVCIHKYKCMCVQLELLIQLNVYTVIITHINVCLQNINDSEKH